TGFRPCKATAGEDVYGVVISVRPNSVFWIVREVSSKIELIAVVTPGCIRSGRDSNALLILRERVVELQLAHKPAAGEVIVKHYWVSTVRRFELAGAAKTGPQGVDGSRCHHLRACTFVIHCDRYIYDLHILGRAGRAVRIRRDKGETKYIPRVLRTLAFEVQICGHPRQDSPKLLCHRVRGSAAEGSARWARLRHLLRGALRVALPKNHVPQRG